MEMIVQEAQNIKSFTEVLVLVSTGAVAWELAIYPAE